MKIDQVHPVYGSQEAAELVRYIADGGWGSDHKKTREFEALIARELKVPYCSVTTSGTQALIFALLALGVKQGDEVLIPALTMLATATAVMMVGATPVFIDVDSTGCLSLEGTLNRISKDTKAVIYVSLNGRSNNMIRFVEELHRRNIPVIEDACQSFGSIESDKALGTFGDIGCFSFSPHKIISTGQGGCSVTNDIRLFNRLRELKDFGRLEGGKDFHPEFGINGKFSDFLAVVGIEQIKTLERRKQHKAYLYHHYYQELRDVVDFIDHPSIPWFVDIYVNNREKLATYLASKGIGTRPIYPVLTTQPILKSNECFPKAEEISERGLWLPSSVDLSIREVEEICKHIKDFIQ